MNASKPYRDHLHEGLRTLEDCVEYLRAASAEDHLTDSCKVVHLAVRDIVEAWERNQVDNVKHRMIGGHSFEWMQTRILQLEEQIDRQLVQLNDYRSRLMRIARRALDAPPPEI